MLGKIENIETIAVGTGVHDIARLRKMYGRGRWRKLKVSLGSVWQTAQNVMRTLVVGPGQLMLVRYASE